jgi:hypothetical protein
VLATRNYLYGYFDFFFGPSGLNVDFYYDVEIICVRFLSSRRFAGGQC